MSTSTILDISYQQYHLLPLVYTSTEVYPNSDNLNNTWLVSEAGEIKNKFFGIIDRVVHGEEKCRIGGQRKNLFKNLVWGWLCLVKWGKYTNHPGTKFQDVLCFSLSIIPHPSPVHIQWKILGSFGSIIPRWDTTLSIFSFWGGKKTKMLKG